MKISNYRLAGAFALLAVGTGLAQDQAREPGFIHLQPAEVQFASNPDNPSVSSAALSGDPATEGIYVIRLRVGAGVTFPPHYHDQDRHITVISGTWAFGTGDSGKCEDTLPLMAGSYVMHPKGAVHFDGSCGTEPVELQIIGLGPVNTFGVESD